MRLNILYTLVFKLDIDAWPFRFPLIKNYSRALSVTCISCKEFLLQELFLVHSFVILYIQVL
jgi:hypothetical protein